MSNTDYNILFRPLKSGKDYDSLLPKTFCESTRLSSGNTETTVNHMIDWVRTHQKQTEKLSTVLKGRTLAETVTSIYDFLYHHIQYKADGTDQLLRSPACGWYQRKEGIDCKSYSIFASSILTNLRISHIIRQVKQPFHFPEQFTHVYIVVPKNGKDLKKGYFVIDATKHENTEVQFTEKKDVFMSLPHYGLNGAAPLITDKTQEGFENYLKLLKSVGVRIEVINSIRSEVYKYLKQGIDPDFKIYKQGVIINRKRFLFETNNGLNRSGSSLRSAISAIEQLSMNPSGLGNPDQSTNDNNQNSDQELEEVTQVVLNSNWFEDTFGSIFANGFDFSCWGSSYNESTAKKHVAVDMPFIVSYSGLDKQITAPNLARFLNLARGYQADAIGGQNPRFAKCTRKGHAIRQQAVEAVIAEVMNGIGQGFTLKSFGKVEGNVKIPQGLPGYAAGRSYQWGRVHGTEKYEYTSYALEPKTNTSNGGAISIGNGNGNSSTDSGGGNTPIVTNPINPNPTNPTLVTGANSQGNTSGTSSNANIGIAVGALAIGGLLFNKQIKNAFTKK
ncbi:hypothetical protein [Aquimarina litoralis]|uniref:hypothetical protein n=1 Tax=Aquimarina litoralis TaxID=584605 RepID=UPI001C5A1CE2|nr:hypothetical protein [Aquimarina litoralis]MBW1296429.1 hypothetical protein [Aquimarina litoralis]